MPIQRDNLANRLRDGRRVLLTLPLLREKLVSLIPSIDSDNIEVQLTGSETCNLRCWYCSTRRWGAGINQTQPFFDRDNLHKLKLFHPKAIILSGGEPTLYHPKDGFGFNEAILEIVKAIPRVKIGLITNGTIFPLGQWKKTCQWVRISLDAGQRSTYKQLKCVDLFDVVIANFHQYLTTKIPFVGIGFVYQKENFDEIYSLLKYVYSSVSLSDRKRVSIQLRPIVYYPDHLPSGSQIDLFGELLESETDKRFIQFCLNNTNVSSLFSKKSVSHQSQFSHCYLCRVHKAITSNGDVYPCCLVFKNKEYCLGNLSQNTPQEIAQKEYEFYDKSPCISTCRLNQKNEYLEKSIRSGLSLKPAQFTCPYFF